MRPQLIAADNIVKSMNKNELIKASMRPQLIAADNVVKWLAPDVWTVNVLQ